MNMTAWNNLNIKQRAELMKIYLQNGITSLSEMKEHYNGYAAGGHIYQDGRLHSRAHKDVADPRLSPKDVKFYH